MGGVLYHVWGVRSERLAISQGRRRRDPLVLDGGGMTFCQSPRTSAFRQSMVGTVGTDTRFAGFDIESSPVATSGQLGGCAGVVVGLGRRGFDSYLGGQGRLLTKPGEHRTAGT